MTKKEALKPPPLRRMFEDILQGRHTASFHDATDWRECRWACRIEWLKPLLEMGAIVETAVKPAWPDDADTGGRERFNYHEYQYTEVGLKWWIDQQAAEVKERAYHKLIEPRGYSISQLEGKGIGAEIAYPYFWGDGPIAVCGIQDGYFEFVSFYNYPYDFTGKRITVRLTAKGMHFFDSLPRLDLECA